MGKRRKRCKNCYALIGGSGHNPRQRYCGRRKCQQARKTNHQQHKRNTDPTYREYDKAASADYRKRNPNRQRNYRRQHPEYEEENRLKQRERNRRRRIVARSAKQPKKADCVHSPTHTTKVEEVATGSSNVNQDIGVNVFRSIDRSLEVIVNVDTSLIQPLEIKEVMPYKMHKPVIVHVDVGFG